MNVFEEFKWRGMLYDASEGLEEALTNHSITGYIGFDPTAASLHVGSLLPIMGLVRLQQHGHTPIALVGGGTGMIGDPSGKTQERQLLSKEQIEQSAVLTLTDEVIEGKLVERNEARKQKDFKKADEIRQSLASHGIVIEDKPDGTSRWKR